jgi:hypothetical protein
MTFDITDEMVYAFAGEPEITATDAHAIKVGLAKVLAIVERDHDARYGRLLAANRKLVDRLHDLERIEDERDRALGALEDARRQLARPS